MTRCKVIAENVGNRECRLGGKPTLKPLGRDGKALPTHQVNSAEMRVRAHRIDRLQAEHIEKLYAKLQKEGLKPASVHHVHRTLRTALNEAVRRGHVAQNPAQVAKPRLVEEARRILTQASQRRNGVRFALALTLGLRQGEALGLQWRDVDFDAGTMTIRRAIQRHPAPSSAIQRHPAPYLGARM